MLLADVVSASSKVSGTSSRNSKASLIAALLRQCAREVAEGTTPRDEIGLATRFLSGTLRQRRTGIALSSLWERSWSDLPEPSDAGIVTLTELDRVMQDSSDMAGAVELAELRRAVAAQEELAAVAQALLVEGPDALGQFHLTVGRGGRPMLATSAKKIAEALAKTGPAGVEWKLDGIRAQIHKQDNDTRILTRSLDDIADRVPEVAELVRSFPVASAIFDGELIALHPDGRPKPFQENGSRTASRVDPEVARERTPLTAYLFDVLHLDGADLIDEPNRGRRAALERAVALVHLTPWWWRSPSTGCRALRVIRPDWRFASRVWSGTGRTRRRTRQTRSSSSRPCISGE
jgi:ATP-dependent DNA ligase